jgi:hypothetical protein
MRWAGYSRSFDEESEGGNSHSLTTIACKKAQFSWALSHIHTLWGSEVARNKQNVEKDGVHVVTLYSREE